MSLCMIIKDEEKVLGRCLESVREIVDEIVIVDTGSTDASRDIARNFGARVFDYSWNCNFSQARNYSLDLARGEWILVLDADEVLKYDSRESFLAYLEDESVEGYWLTIINYLGELPDNSITKDMAVRLFRNRPEYRFEGEIHEQVRSSISRNRRKDCLVRADLFIHHYGYLSEVMAARNKRERNEKIINLALKKKVNDPFLLYSLACEKFIAGDIAGALPLLRQALSYLSPEETYFEDVVFKTGLCLYSLERAADLRELLDYACNLPSPGAGILFLTAMVCLENSSLNRAEGYLKKCLAVLDDECSCTPLVEKYQVYQALGEVKQAKGQFKEALDYYHLASEEKPDYLYPASMIIKLCREDVVADIGRYLHPGSSGYQFSLLLRFNWDEDPDMAVYLVTGIVKDMLEKTGSDNILLLKRLLLTRPDNKSPRIAAALYILRAFLLLTTLSPASASIEPACFAFYEQLKKILLLKEVF